MTLQDFIIKAGPVPYLDRGRSFAGWDCWGLVFCAFRDVSGIDLPAYSADYASARDVKSVAAAIDAARGSWRRIPAGQPALPMDVVLMNYLRHPVHIGLAIGGGEMLHAFEGGGTVRGRINHPMAPNRVEGIYRYAA